MAIDQYATIGETYEKAKDLPLSRHGERFTFLRAIGDVRGKTILDVGCGAGFYTRLLRRDGGSEVVGVDLSATMIEAARRKEAAEPLGITYHVHDVTDLPRLGDFDLVTSAYLLNYAPDEVTLTAMCQRVSANLADSGSFVYIGMNPSFRQGEPEKYEKYGLLITSVTPTAEGFRMGLALIDKSISFDAYHLPMPAYERALARSGFGRVEWIPMMVSDEGVEEFGNDFWADTLDNPTLIALRASR